MEFVLIFISYFNNNQKFDIFSLGVEMKKNLLKKIIFDLNLLIYILFLVSCGKEVSNSVLSEETVVLNTVEINISEKNMPVQKWHKTNKTLCVLLGYGYNSPEVSSQIIDNLSLEFGLEKDNGLVLPLIYPDDFKRGNKYFISELKNILKDKDLCGIVLLGAPEGTNNAIAKIEDSYDGEKPFPVFSFFSQDELLGMEYVADFVLDKEMKANISGEVEEEAVQEPIADFAKIVIHATKSMVMLERPLKKDKNLQGFVEYIVLDNKINRYVDPDTGLYSINHFVLE